MPLIVKDGERGTFRSKWRDTGLAAVAMAAFIAPAVAVGTAGPAAADAPCGTSAPDLDGSSWAYSANGHNMRDGSNVQCDINGIAYSSHRLDYHCYTTAYNGSMWTYMRNDTTGAQGWIADSSLDARPKTRRDCTPCTSGILA
ncbi:hypothetical protein [Streptomyces sp. NPDC058683]|uniref:hypothetical protein n=1 Tax=Streptomyces sp. NPDC058683 TaxID=3346597 RepID=UPI003649F5B8